MLCDEKFFVQKLGSPLAFHPSLDPANAVPRQLLALPVVSQFHVTSHNRKMPSASLTY